MVRDLARTWSESEEDTFLSWLENHPESFRMSRLEIAQAIKKDCFPDARDLTITKIKCKYGNMKKNYKNAKKKAQQSGFGISEDDDEETIRALMNRKCRWYSRLDELFADRRIEEGEEEEGEADTDAPATHPAATAQTAPSTEATASESASAVPLSLAVPTLQTRPTQSVAMQGDSFSGLADLERPLPSDDDEDDELDPTPSGAPFNATADIDSLAPVAPVVVPPPASSTPRPRSAAVPPSSTSPQPTQQQASQQQQQTPASPSEGGRKRKRRANETMDELMAVMDRRAEAQKTAAIEVAKVKAAAKQEIAKEETQRHEATMGMLSSFLANQNEMLKAQQEQQNRYGDLLEKLMDKL